MKPTCMIKKEFYMHKKIKTNIKSWITNKDYKALQRLLKDC